LRTCDPVFARVVESVGPCRFKTVAHLSHYEAVARSIIYQQLSGKAASTIHARFEALFGDERPQAGGLTRLSDEVLRGAGISRQKLAYLRDLSARVVAAEIPIDSLAELGDEEIVRHLTAVKGVGRWTAQMFLMFRLGRPDVLPELDLGIKKGIQQAYRLRKLPTPERVLAIGAKWAPHRTIASWYLWRSIDGDAT
ncbi:MAG: hypothetical protein ABIZ91_02950, partial [Gemmatimonadaceae bacterium]